MAAAAVILVAAALLAAAPWEVPQRLVALPDGRRLNLYCSGRGRGPTVILEAGYAATTWAWARTQPLIAARHRVCSYDRAGMGFSDPGPYPRDGAHVVADLSALLAAAKLAPPYILVGHSAGGLTMRQFADSRPRDIAGMVLVDPSVEGQFDGQESAVAARVAADERCAAATAARALPSPDPKLARCTPKPPATPSRMSALIAEAALRPDHWRTLASEYASIAGANSAAVRAGRQDYGDLPLVILTAGQTDAAEPRWSALHRAIAARSTRGEQRTVAGASHNIMRDNPSAVAAAVETVAGR